MASPASWHWRPRNAPAYTDFGWIARRHGIASLLDVMAADASYHVIRRCMHVHATVSELFPESPACPLSRP
jgi:hypothetical protein